MCNIIPYVNCPFHSMLHPFKFLPAVFSFGSKKLSYSVQFKMILSNKVNLCYGNGLAPCYLPRLHEGSDWLRAIAKLVAHFHRPGRGNIMCQLIKSLGAAAEPIQLDKWLHLDKRHSDWDSVTLIRFLQM